MIEEMEEGPSRKSLDWFPSRERRLRDVSLDELSRVTRVPLWILEDLEADRLEGLPPEVYVKGFLQSCAGYLGLDEDDMLTRFELQSGHPDPMVERKSHCPKRSRAILAAALVTLVMALLAFVIGLRRSSQLKGSSVFMNPAHPLYPLHPYC